MTVAELIQALQKMPQDSKVYIPITNELSKWDGEIRDIINNKDGTVDLDNWPAEGYF